MYQFNSLLYPRETKTVHCNRPDMACSTQVQPQEPRSQTSHKIDYTTQFYSDRIRHL